jgi:imidazolonepropionase-like amidohydrolase
MKKIASVIILLCLLVSIGAFAQTAPSAAQTESILLLGGTAHLGTGDKIEGAAIGFVNGKITFIGSEKNVDPGSWDRVVKTGGKHIYPGFIAPNSRLGLVEIGAVRATRDYNEVGTFKPHVRSAIAYNADSEITPTVRANGVLIGQITPAGGTISGTSSIMQFDAWNWEDALLSEDDGIHVNWPSVYHKHYEKEKVLIEKVKSYDQQLQEIESFFTMSKAYCDYTGNQTDIRLEAMRGLFDGSKRMYVHAHDMKQITEAVSFKKRMGIKTMVIVGGRDSYLVTDMLRDNAIAVMIQCPHTIPRYDEDDIDLSFKLPKLLQDEGVLFCIENEARMSEMNSRNIPFLAGTAVSYGLTYEQGVMAVTLSTARILGIDDFTGSIEMGKDATLFVSEGDALDMRGNDLTHAWIQGRDTDLDTRQKQLYRKYKAKYDAQN